MFATSIRDKPPLILLFGPTAVGKTELLIELFEGKGEVISADSMQVYKGLDIGTAKPPKDYLQRLPHHLIDIKAPHEQFSAGDFLLQAQRLIPEIYSRGKIPVLSGGTAFYFKNFLYGLPEIPPIHPSYRRQLNKELLQNGLKSLYEELCRYDRASGERLASGDSARIVRALEVFRGTGKPLSAYKLPVKIRDDYPIRIIGIQRDRAELYWRINRRVDIMFEKGLVDEIKSLMERGIRRDSPAMKGIGYREFFDMKNCGCMTLRDLRDKIKQNSRRYAKRQITFFQSLKEIKWFSPLNIGEIKKEVFSYQNQALDLCH